jgi:signal transduction histidine kinase
MRTKGLIVIAIPLIALANTASADLVLQANESQERHIAVTAGDLSAAADQVLADAVSAESGIRGYAATRDVHFLAPYNLTLTRIGAERRSLRTAALAEGDIRQQRAADATAAAVLADLARLRAAVSAGMSARDLRPTLENEKTSMDLLRRQIASLASDPAAVAVTRSDQVAGLQETTTIVDIAGLVLGLLAGLVGGALFTTGISRRVAANAANADRLGRGQILEPGFPAGDEIGRLAESHVRARALLASRAAELTAARDVALRATRAKNTFLANTSHELRTPLHAILGFTQLLELSDLSEEDQDSAARILGAGRHLLTLINDLIDIAGIESGDLSLVLEPVCIPALVEEASRLMAPLAAERSIHIVRHCASRALAARADRQRLSQILVNLISNAVKYNRPGGTITITCQPAGISQASVVVSDTGPGLSPDDIERVFVPFERLGAERTATEGSGIGLPLARALTEAMSGQLSAASVLGAGSAFTVTLPRAQDVIGVPPPAAASSAPAPRRAPPAAASAPAPRGAPPASAAPALRRAPPAAASVQVHRGVPPVAPAPRGAPPAPGLSGPAS